MNWYLLPEFRYTTGCPKKKRDLSLNDHSTP